MKKIKDELEFSKIPNLNPLIINMSSMDPTKGKEYIHRNNVSSNFYNVTDLLDEALYKKISTIIFRGNKIVI